MVKDEDQSLKKKSIGAKRRQDRILSYGAIHFSVASKMKIDFFVLQFVDLETLVEMQSNPYTNL